MNRIPVIIQNKMVYSFFFTVNCTLNLLQRVQSYDFPAGVFQVQSKYIRVISLDDLKSNVI